MKQRYLISGSVQGVGYRYFASRHARRLGLRGWVSNLPDGRVEVVAEGDAARMQEFEQALSRGPTLASVSGVERVGLQAEMTDLGSFEIR